MFQRSVVQAASGSIVGLLLACLADHRRLLESFVKLGIGPRTIRTVDGDNLKATYRGKPADFAVKLCLANS